MVTLALQDRQAHAAGKPKMDTSSPVRPNERYSMSLLFPSEARRPTRAHSGSNPR